MPARGTPMPEQEEVDWIRIECWGRVAEGLAVSARKGSRILVMGKLVTNSWTDKYGQNRNDLKVRVRRAEVLQSGRASTSSELKYNAAWEQDFPGMDQEEEEVAPPPVAAAPAKGYSKREYGGGSKGGEGAARPAWQSGGRGSSGAGAYRGGKGVPEEESVGDDYGLDSEVPF